MPIHVAEPFLHDAVHGDGDVMGNVVHIAVRLAGHVDLMLPPEFDAMRSQGRRKTCPVEAPALPAGFMPEYYVLVTEQLLRPGIRVYAWGKPSGAAGFESDEAATRLAVGAAINPHWSATEA